MEKVDRRGDVEVDERRGVRARNSLGARRVGNGFAGEHSPHDPLPPRIRRFYLRSRTWQRPVFARARRFGHVSAISLYRREPFGRPAARVLIVTEFGIGRWRVFNSPARGARNRQTAASEGAEPPAPARARTARAQIPAHPKATTARAVSRTSGALPRTWCAGRDGHGRRDRKARLDSIRAGRGRCGQVAAIRCRLFHIWNRSNRSAR